MDGNLAMGNALENDIEPCFMLIDAFPELDGNDIGHLEDAFMKLIQINNTIGINEFIEFVAKGLNS